MSENIWSFAANQASGSAAAAADRVTADYRRLMIRHLRYHGWGIRRIARELGVTESLVKKILSQEQR